MSLLTLANHTADHDWGPGPWWPIIPLFWIAVIVGLFFVARRGGWGRHRSGLATLEQRYASGEIDENEYRERRDVLKGRS